MVKFWTQMNADKRRFFPLDQRVSAWISVQISFYDVVDHYINDKFAWILDAKAPNEKILNTKHVEQAYSYAVHSEIRVPYFALCNGREFVLYHVSKSDPVVYFDMRALPMYWDVLIKLLDPNNVLTYDHGLRKDFGLHLNVTFVQSSGGWLKNVQKWTLNFNKSSKMCLSQSHTHKEPW